MAGQQQAIENLTATLATLTTQVIELNNKINTLELAVNTNAAAVANIVVPEEMEAEPANLNPLQPANLNANRAKVFATSQLTNPRVNQRTKILAHDTLTFMEAVPPEAMATPAIANYVNSQLLTSTASMLHGERFGGWVKASLISQEMGIPAPAQPPYQPPGNNENPQRRGRRGPRQNGRGGARQK
jgi:ABC-type transporter Mla subunit MlaD